MQRPRVIYAGYGLYNINRFHKACCLGDSSSALRRAPPCRITKGDSSRPEIIEPALSHFGKADEDYGRRLREAVAARRKIANPAA